MMKTLNSSLKEWLVLLAASLLLWLVFLGNSALRDWDEGTYALVAREIYRTGNWLYPTIQGEPFLLKPPLMQWLIALCYHLWGVQEFTTRLPAALLTAAGVPLLYAVGREVFKQRLPALFAALVYLMLVPVVRHGRLAMLDGMAISFFLLLVLCLLKARHDRRWAIGVGIGMGLIILTKGMLVLLLVALAGAFLLADKQLNLLLSPYLWAGMLLGNAPALAWYVAEWQHYGTAFLQIHFQAQALERIWQPVENHSGPLWYYLLELLKYTWPWLLFWPGGLYLAWQKRYTSWGSLILIGTVGYLGTISLMRTKLPWYIMPLYPFFALAVGAKLAQVWQSTPAGKGKSTPRDFVCVDVVLTTFSVSYPRIWAWILALLAIGGIGGCAYFVWVNPQPVLILMGIVVTLTMGVAFRQVKQHNRQFIPVLFAGMYLVLGLLMSSHSWIWELNEAFPVKPVAALIRQQVSPGTTIYTSFAYGRPSLDFYSDCKVITADAPALQKLWATKRYLLLDKSTLSQLHLPDSEVLGTAEDFTLIAPKFTATQTK